MRLFGFFFAFLFSFSFTLAAFLDLSESHQNYTAITELKKRGVISGYSDGSFRPSASLNRVEALKVLLLGAEIEVLDSSSSAFSFSDTDTKAWYFKYLVTAQNLGIVSGYPDGSFRPANTVNLAEALKILIESNSLPYEKVVLEAPYFDVPSTAWFAPYFAYAKQNSLFDQADGNISPGKNITRGEFSELIYRVIQLKEQEKASQALVSVYSDSDEGEILSSGEIYSKEAFTAAHREFPYGTKLKVTNSKNGNSVLVTVNDRGPENISRKLKLSHSAFYALADDGEKILSVKIEQLDSSEISANLFQATNSCSFPSARGKIEKDFFENLELFSTLNQELREGEVFNVSGKVKNGTRDLVVFIVDSDGRKSRFTTTVSEDGIFSLDVDSGLPGKKQLGILAGLSGSSYMADLDVYEVSCEKIYQNTYETVPKNLSFKIKENQSYLKWTGTGDLVRVSFKQGEEQVVKYLNKSDDYFRLNPVWFANFAEGEVFWQVAIASSTSGSSFDQDSSWAVSETQVSKITKHHYSFLDEEVLETFELPDTFVLGGLIEISGRIKDEIRIEAEVILPDNNVATLEISADKQKVKNSNGVEIFPKLSTFSLTFKPTQHGTQILEINHLSGVAALNVPVYEEGYLPLIPDFKDLLSVQEPEKLGEITPSKLSAEILNLVNSARSSVSAERVILNPSLSLLAQERADDMANRNYVGHWTPEGKTANDLRFTYGIKMQVSENIAKETSLQNAHLGLMRSAAHRKNILDRERTRIGFGFAKAADETLIVVQIFSSSPILDSDLDFLREQVLDTVNEKRENYLASNTVLHALAQNWVEKMSAEGFFDFQNEAGESLNDSISEAGINSTVGNFIVAHSSLKGLFEEIDKHERVYDEAWKKLGVGIHQDEKGVIKAVLIYTY